MMDDLKKKIGETSSKKLGYYGFIAIPVILALLLITVVYLLTHLNVLVNGIVSILIVIGLIVVAGLVVGGILHVKDEADDRARKFGRSIKDWAKK
ncbi:putative membrane protein [Methanococcus maripaludis]|uniref:Putative membrane protein n=1 Tax=Methanococcus maripaludis TaxID=39152 RepID=A0A7J9P6L1_METMI|nr:hypothetical protein [Methanococcus maripaludis]MBA2858316.1 putative membrane protein [Methanococcus maripaludis]